MRWIGALAIAVVLMGCGGEADDKRPPSDAASATTSETAGSEDPEAAFLRLTAQHLCAVQSSVFDDPADLAAAYEQTPAYPGLSADQIAEFEQRVLDDPEFSESLLGAIAEGCG